MAGLDMNPFRLFKNVKVQSGIWESVPWFIKVSKMAKLIFRYNLKIKIIMTEKHGLVQY